MKESMNPLIYGDASNFGHQDDSSEPVSTQMHVVLDTAMVSLEHE